MKRPAIRIPRVEDLSLEQRVGQMFFARHHALLEDARYADLAARGLIGGVQVAPCATPLMSRALRAELDTAVGIPLLVGADAEEGGVSACPGALAPKIEAFIHFGNPNAVRRLPRGLKNVIVAFAGPTAGQAVLDVLAEPARARGRFRMPAGPRG